MVLVMACCHVYLDTTIWLFATQHYLDSREIGTTDLATKTLRYLLRFCSHSTFFSFISLLLSFNRFFSQLFPGFTLNKRSPVPAIQEAPQTKTSPTNASILFIVKLRQAQMSSYNWGNNGRSLVPLSSKKCNCWLGPTIGSRTVKVFLKDGLKFVAKNSPIQF